MPQPSDNPPLALWAVRNQDTPIPADERRDIANRLREVLGDYYVHLPQKVGSMAINPVRELELLADDADAYFSSHAFFRRLLSIFTSLRDRHTTVRMPAPWNQMIAFLPFVLESCYEDQRRKLIVTKLINAPDDPHFNIGVEITHWNGVPIRTFIENFSWQTNGSNPWARIALALRALTLRPMAYAQPPDEDWVTLTFIDGTGAQRNSTFQWQVVIAPSAPAGGTGAQGGVAEEAAEGAAPLLGLDAGTDVINQGLQALFSRPLRARSQVLGLTAADTGLRVDELQGATQAAPGIRPSILTLPGGESYGVLRIFSFHTNNIRAFVENMANILAQMPQSGLIVDVRANPGGTIPAGEALLRLLTDKPVSFSRNTFLATPATRKLSGGAEFFHRWKRSLDMVLETGQMFSQGFQLVEDAHWQGLEGSYTGPVVAIIDALSYSTTDYFAAGFEDNKIGKIIGLDPTTGAGGANVWSLDQIDRFAQAAGASPMPPLAAGVEANIAVRRALRVGDNDGLPLEGLGARPDFLHLTTRRDIVSGNQDLLLRAVDVLKNNG
ncbi:hypothetical protein J7399_02055 [Shimia sp. R9_1]|uniref:S41 family peptidase n=1 Tax=Shimia sp. R9_1 TaxID=2821111 RepID=UPI001ADCBEF3|nr:S41 family peptidase [Shimia sp. R9_1]MBO9406196.1 hypothetical protein [Shimia sp. R9_1]